MNKINSINVLYHGNPVGIISRYKENLTAFQYAPEWVANGFSISPLSLPLSNKIYISKREPFDGLFGVFSDSLPDGWGKLILERYLAAKGMHRYDFDALTQLSLLGEDSSGALEYIPCQLSQETLIPKIDFDELYTDCCKLLNSELEGSNLDKMFRLSGSSGGTRPKVNAIIDGEKWIVKYPSRYDDKEIGSIEYLYNELASKCCIQVADSCLIESKSCKGFFATKRFDLDSRHERIHMVSAAGLLEADYTLPCIDYKTLHSLTWLICKSQDELKEMFRRMCFNEFAHNRDDHAKNFAFLYDEKNKNWKLSPAYDLTYSNSYNGWHATSINGNGKNPTEEDILAVGLKSGLDKEWCKKTITFIKEKCMEIKFV